MSGSFVTVGHSDRALDDFVGDLTTARVDVVVDVRRFPTSRRYPWFDERVLAPALADAGIDYRRIPALAGRRPASTTVAPEVNALWRNRGFHNYADYATSSEFAAGLAELTAAAEDHRVVAVLCAEAVWWRCHRRIIADHLLATGASVAHLFPGGRLDPAEPTPGVCIGVDGTVTYPSDAARSE